MLVALGIATVLVAVLGVFLVVRFARSHAADDLSPPSRDGEFVAPVSSGDYRFRAPDETREDFKARVDRENDEIAVSRRGEQLEKAPRSNR